MNKKEKKMLIKRKKRILKLIWIFVGVLGIIGMIGFTLIPLFQSF